MKKFKKALSFVLVLALTLCVAPIGSFNSAAAVGKALSFSDVSSNAWYTDAVKYVSENGIMTGYGGTTKFGTADNIQRQDFIVLLARFDGVDLTQYSNKMSPFPDVPNNTDCYYKAAVIWGAQNGIVAGYNNGKFGTGDKITREQLVTFLYRYAKYKGLDTSCTMEQMSVVNSKYSDYKKVTDYAQAPIVWAITNGVISGKENGKYIAPGGNALRCEVAQIMHNIFLNGLFDPATSLEGTTIIFASTIDPKDDGTDYVVSQFEREYGINVEIVVPTLENYCAEMQAFIAAGMAPTVGCSKGDAPSYVGYFQPLDAAGIDYTDPIWDQRMFKLSTYNGSPYLCNTIGNFWTEMDIVVYSKSLLAKANCPTPEALDKAGNWTFDSYLMIGQKTAALEGCNGASYNSLDGLLNMAGGSVYKIDANNRLVNGLDNQTTAIIQKISQSKKDNYLVSGGTQGLINGTVSITTAHLWSLRTDGNLMTHPNWNDLGFYYLPSFEKDGERYVTGTLRGWGIFKGCNDNPQTGSKAALVGGLFLREYLDVNNYDLDRSFLSEEAKAFFFKCCDEYINTDNYNPYYTTYSLNEGISGIDDDKEVYALMSVDPAQIPTRMAAAKAAVQKGVDNLNKYIDQNT